MSILPFLLELSDEFRNNIGHRDYDGDDFGFGIYPQDLRRSHRHSLLSPRLLYLNNYPGQRCLSHNPYSNTLGKFGGKSNKMVKIDGGTMGKNGFQASIDVQQFQPNEITVKTMDNYVIVEGNHEEREDEHGHISRHFIRKYLLPKNYDPKNITSTLSSDGILTVKGPPSKQNPANERIVQIQHTGPHLSAKENVKDDCENGEKNDKMED